MKPIPEKIRKELKKYDNHKAATCFECGYEGLMGVVKEKVDFFVTWPVIIIALLLTVVGGAILFIFRLSGWGVKYILKCPNCKKIDKLEDRK